MEPDEKMNGPNSWMEETNQPEIDHAALTEQLQRLNARAMEFFNGDLDRGVEILQEVFQLAETRERFTPPEQHGFAECYLTLGRFQMKLGLFGSAIHAFFQAQSLYKKAGDKARSGWAQSYIGVAYLHLDEYDKALRHLYAAHQITRGAGDRILTAEISNNISNIYIALGQPERAFMLLEEAIPILREAREYKRLGWALDTLAMAYARSGSQIRALRVEQEAFELACQIESWQDICVISINMGNLYREIGDLPQARRAYQEALAAAQSQKLRVNGMDAWVRLGDLDLQEGKFEPAVATLQRALALARELNRLGSQMDCCRILSQAYEAQDEIALALNYYKQYHHLTEMIFSKEADQRIRNLQALHQLDSLRKEAEDFQKQNLLLRREVEKQKQQKMELEELALTDPLTHAFNRRAFFENGAEILHKAQRDALALTLIMLDVDHFKEVNDMFGHMYGDAVLQTLVASLRCELRQDDLLARYGGEEFVILLPGVDEPFARVVGERLRAAVERNPYKDPQHDHEPITISVGIVVAHAEDLPDNLEVLVNRADEAMYQSKQAGRNCCSLVWA